VRCRAHLPLRAGFFEATYAEVIPAGTVLPPGTTINATTDAQSSALSTVNPAPVYEYWWTLGHTGSRDPTRHGIHFPHPRGLHTEGWQALEDPAAHVYVGFPTTGNWRVKEIMTSLQYLAPLRQEHQTWQKISDDLQALSPLVDDAASLAAVVPGGGAAGTVLSTISRLTIASVPQTVVGWFVEKVTWATDDGNGGAPYQGVAWQLPANPGTT